MRPQSTITITLCDVAENHVGMQKLGELSQATYSYADLEQLANVIPGAELYDLSMEDQTPPAGILVIRSAIPNADEVYQELLNLNWDSKAKMRGKVVNKHARYNLCFGEERQESDFEHGKGTVVAWKGVLELCSARNHALKLARTEKLGYKATAAEGNYYKTCGIGYHGDSERTTIIGIRFGASIPLCYRWYLQSNIISSTFAIILNHGDMYIMSEKAVGKDWKKRSIPTLRHAAGSDKYIK